MAARDTAFHGRLASRQAVALLIAIPVAVSTLASCETSSPQSAPLTVKVEVDVCRGETCFVAPVPDALITITRSGTPGVARGRTDDAGNASFPDTAFGEVEVRSTWAGVTIGPVHTVINPGAVSLSLRMPTAAKVA